MKLECSMAETLGWILVITFWHVWHHARTHARAHLCTAAVVLVEGSDPGSPPLRPPALQLQHPAQQPVRLFTLLPSDSCPAPAPENTEILH